MQRTSPLSRKTGLRRTGSKRAKQNRDYAKVSREYLAAHPSCEICIRRAEDGEIITIHPSTHIHHVRGRTGRLLCATQFFMAACSRCHPRYVHETHVAEARRLGILANARDFGVFAE